MPKILPKLPLKQTLRTWRHVMDDILLALDVKAHRDVVESRNETHETV